jgi:hypothetical protein
MATQVPGKGARQVTLGITVPRAAALLPQTATAAIFNVIGGKVLVTSLVGEVVVVMPATANTVAVNGTPTSGTAVVWATAVSTASKEVGSVISLPITAGGALQVANAGGGNAVGPGFVGQIGTITLTTTGSAATGTVKWTLTYVPIDDGAYVTAA